MNNNFGKNVALGFVNLGISCQKLAIKMDEVLINGEKKRIKYHTQQLLKYKEEKKADEQTLKEMILKKDEIQKEFETSEEKDVCNQADVVTV